MSYVKYYFVKKAYTTSGSLMEMNKTRPTLVRMYRLDEQLRDNSYPNCSTLGRILEVHPKTIQRDIDYLRYRFSAPIAYDNKRKGYYYESEWNFFPSVLLEQQEREALQITRKVLVQYQGTPYYDEVSRALDKVMQYLPKTLPENEAYSIYSFEQPTGTFECSNNFMALEGAIRRQKKVVIKYEAHSTGRTTQRTIHPYRLHYSHGSQTWYLVAYCELRQDVRTFVVGRIKEISVLQEEYDISPDFSVDEYLSKTFDHIVGETEQEVSIRFSAYQTPWMREHRWHPSQTTEENDDGTITIRFRVSALDAVKRWVMRYGKEAEVLGPQELREMVRDEVREMGVVYG